AATSSRHRARSAALVGADVSAAAGSAARAALFCSPSTMAPCSPVVFPLPIREFPDLTLNSDPGGPGSSPDADRAARQACWYQADECEETVTATREEPPQLYRSTDDRLLGGVCSGLARHLGIDPVVARLALLALAVGGIG